MWVFPYDMRDGTERLRANAIPGLLWRLVRAVLRQVWKPRVQPALPRFYCVVCQAYVNPKNIRPANAVCLDSDGAVNEGFLGFQYDVTCHGETKRHYVTLVAQLVGNHLVGAFAAFEPPRGPTTPWVYKEPPEAKARRLAEVERVEQRLQKEIAEAKARRAEWQAQNNVLTKLEELRQLIQTLPIVFPEYEKPGVVTESTADNVQDEIMQAAPTTPTT